MYHYHVIKITALQFNIIAISLQCYKINMIKTARASTAGYRNSRSPTLSLFGQGSQLNKKDKNDDYLTSRKHSYSAQGSRGQFHPQKEYSYGNKSYTKIQSKVPIMTVSSKEDDLKKRISRLGLQSFMKQIVLSQRITDPQFSSKVIYALNKTYLTDELQAPKCQMPSSFGKKTLRESKKTQNLRVDWNPQKQLIQEQFKQSKIYVPNYMFPRRESQATRLIKNKQKKNNENYKKNSFSHQKEGYANNSSYSTNLDQNLKNYHLMNKSLSQKKKTPVFWSNSNEIANIKAKFLNIEQKNKKNNIESNKQSLVLCKKARIYI